VEFSFELAGHGWGEATLSDGERHVVIPASYLSDVLSELLTMVRSLLEGALDAACRWKLEPGEYRWSVTCEDGWASLKVLASPGSSRESGPDDQGTIVFDSSGELGLLASAFPEGIEAVLLDYGEDGYRERWVLHPFPTGLLFEVKELLHP
jgi:hypothetical protein